MPVIGFVIFALKLPEKLAPGKFDHCGQSHQIMHVCVVVGNVLAFIVAQDMYKRRLTQVCL